MERRSVYKLINPSDQITFRATAEEAAVIAVIMLASMYFVKDVETGEAPKPPQDVLATRNAIYADPERKASYASAFRSFLIGSLSERELFEEAVSRMTTEEARDFRTRYHDKRRSSMNDICSRLWAAADKIDAYVETVTA
jgi:hypothetical protein